MELLLLEWSTSQMEWSRPDLAKVDKEEQAEDKVFSTYDDEISADGRLAPLPLLQLLLVPLLMYENEVSGVVDSDEVGLRERFT